jgi:hypothetical protein
VHIRAIRNDIADVDSNAESDCLIGRSVVVGWHLLLRTHRTSHRAVDAVEHQQQRIAAGADDPTTVRLQRRLEYVAPQPAHPIERSAIVQADQTAVADHVGMNHRDQRPPIR